jgi:myb proto-oncogene protein
MQEHKTKNNNKDSNKKKERHIVTWTQQEDDILREQINLHGTDNWAIIASKFKDKTTRQCRRRWYTYLNSDFKKGGWSPEEDLLLCEAQRIFGNRWTEIAKVVSGRTDNAVKNRFSTLQKKKAKYEALTKENDSSDVNPNKKRVQFLESTAPAKRMRRSHLPERSDDTCNYGDRSHKQCGTTVNTQPRPPFTILVQNCHNINNSTPVTGAKDVISDGHSDKTQGTFLKKDDTKVAALMQQAELLTLLAMKVNAENTEESLENAWKVLQEFLNRSKENAILSYKTPDLDLQFEEFRGLMDDLRSSNEGSQQSWRQPALYDESPASSDYSTGSTLMPHTAMDQIEESQPEIQSINAVQQTDQNTQDKEIITNANLDQVDVFLSYDDQTTNDVVVSVSPSSEFGTPLQVTPIFRSLAATIPSPQFSESEQNFLLKTLGMESPPPNPSTNPSHPPPCKRVLLHSL